MRFGDRFNPFKQGPEADTTLVIAPEKLAEWAGFTFMGMSYVGKELWCPPGEVIQEEGPNEEGYFKMSRKASEYFCPDFHNSLDACFKWLMPKMKEMGLRLQYTVMFDEPFPRKHYWAIQMGQTIRGLGEDADSSSKAFCLAVEQLIDNKVSN